MNQVKLTGEEITQWLAENERTIRWLALKAGVEPSVLWRGVRGQRRMTSRTQELVAKVIR